MQSLVKRCQAQDEKMRESAKLRVFNSDLSAQLEELKKALSMKEEEIVVEASEGVGAEACACTADPQLLSLKRTG